MSAQSIPILMYHQIDHIAPKRNHSGQRVLYRSLCVSPSAFARQMRLLQIMGYRGVNMTEVLQYLRGEKTPRSHGRVVGITFDDGYLNNWEYALPILEQRGFSSTCYVVSERVGQHNDWDSAKGVVAKRLMNQEQMRQWISRGQELGSHTQHHVDLQVCDGERAKTEIFQSKLSIEAISGKPCRHFCYPYGAFNDTHKQWVQEAGYESATTVRSASANELSSHFELPRWGILKNTMLPQLAWRVLRGNV